ncbi:unnamed protein product [Commensalibacter communis]|nr:unnamed protein product [Commensalibacter communis]CAI3949039.1 unnamed protein product [Commensalibacter communis]
MYKFCCLLLAAVFIHLCAILLNKEGNWKKTVTVFYWCDWILSVGYVAIFMIAGLLFEERSNISESWSGGGQILREIYSLWLNRVIIKHGLKTTVPKAIVIQFFLYINMCFILYIF